MTVIQRQARVQRVSLPVCAGIQIDLAAFTVREEFLNRHRGLEIDERHVGLHGGTVKGRGSSLAPVLARLIPGGGADSEALGGGDDFVEGVKHGA